jgi:hypothetical protein
LLPFVLVSVVLELLQLEGGAEWLLQALVGTRELAFQWGQA